MSRVNQLQEKSEGANKESDSSNATQTVIDNKLNYSCNTQIEDNNSKYQCNEERAAAGIFPLNLISNRFKLKDSNALKGRYFYRFIEAKLLFLIFHH